MKFYVYLYIDPRNHMPFYVGKGCGNRAGRHLYHIQRNTHTNKYFSNVVRNIWQDGKRPIIDMVCTNVSEATAFSLERDLVNLYGRRIDKSGILTNLVPGGQGPLGQSRSETAKRATSQTMLGRSKTAEACQNMRKPKSAEHARAISKARSMSYCLVSPDGTTFETDCLKEFCEEKKLNLQTMKNAIIHGRQIAKGHNAGWSIKRK